MERGELPHLARAAASGTFARLRTRYGISPVIWTTIATGHNPEEHGIVDFVIETDRGSVPVTSSLRRRPAIWNMASRAGRQVAALGWWATWPAEEVKGLLLSDRAGLGLEQEIFPSARVADLARWKEAAVEGGGQFGGNDASELHDRIVTLAARDALGAGNFEIVLAYYRSLDLASHDFWHRFEPGSFPAGAPEGAATSTLADPVSDAYRAFDQAFGELVAAAPRNASFLVVSDHGFRAAHEGSLQLLVDADRLLEVVGWLTRDAEGDIDTFRSRAWTAGSPPHHVRKWLRLGESSPGANREVEARHLAQALGEVRFGGDRPAFKVRASESAEELARGDLLLEVLVANASPELSLRGSPIPGAVAHFGRITGSHDPQTAGILLASGPIFRSGARVRRPRIHDLAPTVLFALGLPTAEDFPGRVLRELFTPEFLGSMPERRIASWGVRAPAGAAPSEHDSDLIDELAALGYLK